VVNDVVSAVVNQIIHCVERLNTPGSDVLTGLTLASPPFIRPEIGLIVRLNV
jgi:hypothetical protein